MLQSLAHPWPWYLAGPLIGLAVPFVFWYGGKKWGISTSLEHLCAATVGSRLDYFRYDWRRIGGWSLAMVGGIVVGGMLAALSRASGDSVAISAATRADLLALGLTDLSGLLPREVFSWEAIIARPAALAIIVIGSFLVGFGARWAGGCTSGHAISGMSTLRRSSLAAVIGFFAGGLISAHLVLPLLL